LGVAETEFLMIAGMGEKSGVHSSRGKHREGKFHPRRLDVGAESSDPLKGEEGFFAALRMTAEKER
jgi:hypothetical protein